MELSWYVKGLFSIPGALLSSRNNQAAQIKSLKTECTTDVIKLNLFLLNIKVLSVSVTTCMYQTYSCIP